MVQIHKEHVSTSIEILIEKHEKIIYLNTTSLLAGNQVAVDNHNLNVN
jgi:hypothetical protein